MRTILLLFLFIRLTCAAQQWHPPLDPPLYLSGSFGELRSDHFHSGIDIKTGGITGKPVYAVEQGEVVRIRVGPYGFGNALYLRHPNGKTTVYAHLSKFDPAIASYVRSEQYRLQKFAVDLYPAAGRFVFKKGATIARSGNSGSSDGPHLHFEVRNTANGRPMDPLAAGFAIADHQAPLMENLLLVPISRNAHCNGRRETVVLPLTQSKAGQYRTADKETIRLSGRWGFAIETTDQQDGASGMNGTIRLRMFLDDSLRYAHRINEFSFDETRYLNSFITFDQYQCCSNRATRLYVEPNNRLSFVQGNPAGYTFTHAGSHSLRIEACDRAGNRSVVEFSFEGIAATETGLPPSRPVVYSGEKWLTHNETHRLSAGDARCVIPAGVLYADIYFPIEESEPNVRMSEHRPILTSVYRFGHGGIPAHTYFTLDLPLPAVPEGCTSEQLCFAEIEEDGQQEWWPGKWKAGRFIGRSREFGRYAVTVDTLPPMIDPVNIYTKKDMSRSDNILLRIMDDFSGINEIRGTIDGQWVLMEWDPKTHRLWHTFDERCAPGAHTFELRLTDHCGNESRYAASFSR